MEFKGQTGVVRAVHILVDIGTEWNLKLHSSSRKRQGHPVDIGTEWNLKLYLSLILSSSLSVDIGTEWNLKEADILKMGGWSSLI